MAKDDYKTKGGKKPSDEMDEPAAEDAVGRVPEKKIPANDQTSDAPDDAANDSTKKENKISDEAANNIPTSMKAADESAPAPVETPASAASKSAAGQASASSPSAPGLVSAPPASSSELTSDAKKATEEEQQQEGKGEITAPAPEGSEDDPPGVPSKEYPPVYAYRPLTVPEKLNWVDEILAAQLAALPQPVSADSPEEHKRKIIQTVKQLAPEQRGFYNMYQFHQYVGRGLWPWGYHVRLDRADQFLHCTPSADGTDLKPFSILFRFQPYSHTLPKERRHVYVVTIYNDDLSKERQGPTSVERWKLQAQASTEKAQQTQESMHLLSTTQREWNKMYDRLKAYKGKFGNTKVPSRYKEDRQLGRWVVEQRFNYNNKKLSQERIDRLNEVEFTWKLRHCSATKKKRDVSSWDEKFKRLKEYKEKHGSCNVPMSYDEDPSLANWIATQRHKYRTNRLNKDEISTLNGIGFVWKVRKEYRESNSSWGENFRLLKKQEEVNNIDFEQEPFLADWAENQRLDFAKGNLAAERQKKLESVGFQFEIPSDGSKKMKKKEGEENEEEQQQEEKKKEGKSSGETHEVAENAGDKDDSKNGKKADEQLNKGKESDSATDTESENEGAKKDQEAGKKRKQSVLPTRKRGKDEDDKKDVNETEAQKSTRKSTRRKINMSLR